MDLDTVTDFVAADTATWRPGDAWLGGGTWLFSEPQLDVTRLLDLTAFDWAPVTETPQGRHIAATCTLAQLAGLPRRWPADELIEPCCIALLGSFKIWHTATVGGNLCLALAAAPMISLTAALDGVATCVAVDGSVRDVAVLDFVTGAGRTVLEPGEYLRSVFLPAAALDCRTAMRTMSLTPVGRSAAVVIARLDPVTGAVALTVTASTDRPYQLRFASLPSTDEALTALDEAIPQYYDDVHGSPAWRRAITRRLVADVLAELATPLPPAQALPPVAARP